MKMDSEKFTILDSVENITNWVLKGYKAFKEHNSNLKTEQILLGITSIGVTPPAPQGKYNVYLLNKAEQLPGIVGLIIEFSCAKIELHKKSRTEIKKIIINILNVLEGENYSNNEKYGFLEKKFLVDGLKIYLDYTLEFTERVKLLKKKVNKMTKNLHSTPVLTDYGYGTKPKKGLILRGTLTWENGASYKGALKSLKKQIPHGYGVYFFPENEQWATVKGLKVHKIKSYIGEFKNGNFHGKGTFRSVGDYNYKGDFKNGRFYGKGKIEYDTGESFEGIFKNDKKVKGKWLLENGDIYEGEIKNETAHGKGKGIYKKSRKTYVGQFKNGAFHGNGKWWTDKGEVCEGEFKNGGRHGRCKQTFTKGKVAGTQYIGQWKDNLKSGKGRMKYYDGAEYKGYWKNNEYDGFGILKEKNGEVEKGIWSNGELTKPKK